MKELYGVLGAGSASPKIISAALDDVGTKVEYILPWYGRPTPGLEAVYDWMIDNNAEYTIVGSEKMPKALTDDALDFAVVKNVNAYIFEALTSRDPSGMSLILWDDEREEISLSIASQSIESGLPTLDLTNGLVPIIFEDEPEANAAPVVTEEIEEEDPSVEPPQETAPFTKEELETMPAASVKRMAKDIGFDVKTKEEAIDRLLGTVSPVISTQVDTVPMQGGAKSLVSITLHYDDGSSAQHYLARP